MIRVLIVDDSRVVREILKDLIQDTGISVVGEAVNGQEAIELTKKFKPDLITMDVMMPVMDGLTSVEHIMAEQPTPILIFSSSVNKKEVNIAFEAIQLGALDVMEKPENIVSERNTALKAALIQKIRLLSNIKVIRHIRGRRRRLPLEEQKVVEKVKEIKARRTSRKFDVVAVGASTGGPKAVMSIFKSIPADFPVGMLLVQHIGANFTQGFVEWLDRDCALTVKMAEEGEKIEAGKILVAPGDVHMETRGDSITLTRGPAVHNCKPSVDVLFQSVARSHGDKALGVLLTGMGRDGADGLLEMKRAKAQTIVQDEESSVIFGMPKAAIEIGAADQVENLKDIPAEIVKKVGGGNGQNSGG